MKERTFWKRITAHLLVMCMLATTLLWGIKPEAVFAADSETTIYFLNSKGWENVGAYVWSDAGAGELLGSWGSTQAAASDLGNNWVQVTITDWDLVSSFHIIFYNVDNQDTDRVDIYIEDAQHTYTTLDAKAYVSQTEAENAWNSTKTTVYFLNDDQTEGTTYTKMDNVYAYVYGDATGEVLGGWPGKAAEKATEVGDNWWKVEVSANAAVTPFNIIFTDNAGKQAPDTYITSESNNYVIPKTIEQDGEEKAVVFASSGEAEKAVGIVHNTTVYFLNSKDWVNVGAYVYLSLIHI